jgi:hypothetical protein
VSERSEAAAAGGPSSAAPGGAPGDGSSVHELTPRGRTVGVVAWCSFLAAAGATTVLFAFLDPAALQEGDAPSWWTNRHTVYAIGFFFCWLVAACSAALTIYMAHTDK